MNLKQINNIISCFLEDLKSFRVQLCYWALALTFIALFRHPECFNSSITLLGIVYTYYFASKSLQHVYPGAKGQETQDTKETEA